MAGCGSDTQTQSIDFNKHKASELSELAYKRSDFAQDDSLESFLCKTRRKPTALCCGMNSYIMKDFACKNLSLMLLK